MINRNFLLLLAGQLVSQVGDKFHMIALSFWVLKTTGSSAKMGVVLAASLVPCLILGFFSGAVIDRYNRKIIIVGTDVVRGLILAVFALVFYFGKMHFYVVLTLQVLLSVNAAFFDPAVPSLIPQIVDKKDLATANSRHQLVYGFATIVGAFSGGIFISVFGYLWVFVVNAVSFLVSAGFECFIRIPRGVKADCREKKTGIWTDMKQGYQYVLSKRTLVVLLFMVLVIHFCVGAMEVFMPVIADSVSTDGEKNLGFFQTAFGLGTILTALVLGIKTISGKEKPVLFGSVFFMGLLYVLASFFNGSQQVMITLFCVLIFLFGSTMICAGISFKTLLQKRIDNAFAGRVFALAGSIGNASIPGAMILYGFLLEKYSFQGLLMGSGLVLMLLSIVSFIGYKEEKHGRSIKTFSKSVTKN